MTTRVFTADGSELQSVSPIVASAYRSGAAQSIANNTLTVVDLDSSAYSVGHSTSALTVDLTNNRIVATVAGYYRITCGLVLGFPGAPAAGSAMSMSACVNGTEIRSLGCPLVANASGGGTVTVTAYMSVGDYADMRVYQNSGGAINTLTGANTRPTIQVELVR